MSIFDLSENAANSIYGIANVAVLIASILGVAGTIALFWTRGIRDKYSEIKASKTEEPIALAHTEAARANERSKALENDSARLQKETAQARLELEQIKEKQKPRTISGSQRNTLISAARAAVGLKISVTCIAGDSEAMAFARQIKECLLMAGVDVVGVNQATFGGGTPVGVIMGLKSQQAPPVAAIVQSALTLAGIRVPAQLRPDDPDDFPSIFVGSKQ